MVFVMLVYPSRSLNKMLFPLMLPYGWATAFTLLVFCARGKKNSFFLAVKDEVQERDPEKIIGA